MIFHHFTHVQVRISLYKAGAEVFYTLFDAVGSDKENWIERSRILECSATDMLTETIAHSSFFTLRGWVILISLTLVDEHILLLFKLSYFSCENSENRYTLDL